ncbi:MAG: alpha/beta hydrolase [Balneolales bacterium]
MNEKSVKVNGVNMRWLEKGNGEPVVFIHGLPTSPDLWRYVVPELTNKKRIAWEMIGYGSSIEEGRHRDISVGHQAAYLASWLDAMDYQKVTLVGHDLGGGVAQIIATLRPNIVQGLVLVNSICYDSWPIPRVKALRALGPVAERFPNTAVRLAMKTFLQEGHVDNERAEESMNYFWRHYEHINAAEAIIRQLRYLDVKDTMAISHMLPDIKVPSRVVWGASDHFQTIDYGNRLARDLNAPIDRIEGGKHFVPIDYPKHVAKAVEEVLKEQVFAKG